MLSVFNENPSREKILFLLKKQGPMSIDNLSKELSITSMGIRQHLLSLERKGLIDYTVKRQGIGRPAFLYRLTEKAEELFPKTYDKFAMNLLKDIEKHEGPEKIDEIFKWRKNRIIRDAKEAVSDKKNFQDKLYGVKSFLESEGYFSDVQAIDNHYTLKVFNCPIHKIASDFKLACQYDLQMFRDLLGKDITREECIMDGNPYCTYIVPKSLSK